MTGAGAERSGGPAPWLHAEARRLREQAIERETRRDAGDDGGDPALSLAELNRAASLDPQAAADDALLAFYRGALLARMQRVDEAVSELKRALRVDREHGGLTGDHRGRAYRGLGRLLGCSGVELGDPDRIQDALRCLNKAIDLGAKAGVPELLEEFKTALAALPPGGVGLTHRISGEERGRDAVGLIGVQLNDRAEGFGDRERVRERLDRLYTRAFEPLRAGRAAEAVVAAREFLMPRFRGRTDPAEALATIDEADLAALAFLGAGLRRVGREPDAAAALKAVMAQVPYQSRVLPELRFLFRLAYEDLRQLAEEHGWMWVNNLSARRHLQELFGMTPPRRGGVERPPLSALFGLIGLVGVAVALVAVVVAGC